MKCLGGCGKSAVPGSMYCLKCTKSSAGTQYIRKVPDVDPKADPDNV